MAAGTIGLHRLEGYSCLESFYFMSMVATAQGPSQVPQTDAGKLFTALMAFLSVGSVVTVLGFLFGPFLGQVWRSGVEGVEHEAHVLFGKKDRK